MGMLFSVMITSCSNEGSPLKRSERLTSTDIATISTIPRIYPGLTPIPYTILSIIATKKGINDHIAVVIPRFNPDNLEALVASTIE